MFYYFHPSIIPLSSHQASYIKISSLNPITSLFVDGWSRLNHHTEAINKHRNTWPGIDVRLMLDGCLIEFELMFDWILMAVWLMFVCCLIDLWFLLVMDPSETLLTPSSLPARRCLQCEGETPAEWNEDSSWPKMKQRHADLKKHKLNLGILWDMVVYALFIVGYFYSLIFRVGLIGKGRRSAMEIRFPQTLQEDP